MFDHQSLTNVQIPQLKNSPTHKFLFPYIIQNKGIENFSMLNMYMFDLFSDCHSLSHGYSLVYILAYDSGI